MCAIICKEFTFDECQVIFQEPWQYFTRKHNINILKEYPQRYNSYPADVSPVYW